MGYELVDLEFAARGVLRVTIDWPLEKIEAHLEATRGIRKKGAVVEGELDNQSVVLELAPWDSVFVNIEDCEKVSRQLTYVLTVENIEYNRLEVSSPGLDRPLKSDNDFKRFAGQDIKLRLREPLKGRRNFEGTLVYLGANELGLDWDELPKTSPVEAGKAVAKAAGVKKFAPKSLEAQKSAKAAKLKGAVVNRLSFELADIEKANLVPQIIFNRAPKAPMQPKAAKAQKESELPTQPETLKKMRVKKK